MIKLVMIFSGIFACLAVILGAFAAHGLKKKISADRQLVFKTGVDYQFYHSFALALVGLSMIAQNSEGSMFLYWSFICFSVGIVFFSGSLYLLALTKNKIFGPITPLGGLFFISGWVFFTLHWF